MTEQTLAHIPDDLGRDGRAQDSLAEYGLAPPAGMDDVPVGPIVIPEPGTSWRRLLPIAVVISCGLHAAAAAAMLMSTASLPEYGVLKTDSNAMSLETTQTIVLESTMSEPVNTAAAAAAAMPQGSMESVEAEPVPVKDVSEVPVEKAVEPPTVKAAEADPDATETSEEPLEVLRGAGEPAETAPTRTIEKKPEEKQKAERETRKKKRHEQVKRQRQRRQTAGGPTSRSQASKGKTSGRASASRGSVLSYGARVRAKVARNRPSGRGHRGTARVSFAVSSSGGLSYARLARSCGNSALDQAALAAVRRAAPFGAPPAGASPSQLRFSIPFYFK